MDRSNNSVLEDKGVLQRDFDANKMPAKITKEEHLEERRFRNKLVEMIKDADSKFDDYSHWVYELTEKYFFIDLTN